MSLWWLEKGWTQTCCARCGKKIWPEGDPDWGLCYDCFNEKINAEKDEHRYYEEAIPMCDICKTARAVTDVNGYHVCSQECADKAIELKEVKKEE